MEKLEKIHRKIKYIVYYEADENLGMVSKFHVKIIKFNYTILEGGDFIDVISKWEFKRWIENSLCMPCV